MRPVSVFQSVLVCVCTDLSVLMLSSLSLQLSALPCVSTEVCVFGRMSASVLTVSTEHSVRMVHLQLQPSISVSLVQAFIGLFLN